MALKEEIWGKLVDVVLPGGVLLNKENEILLQGINTEN